MVFGAAAGYALLPALTKIAYEHGTDAPGLLALRYAIAGPLLIALARARRPAAVSLGALRVAAVPAAIFFVSTWTFFESLARMSGAIAVVIVFSFPILVAIGGVILLGELLTASRSALILLGTFGVYLSAGVSGRATGPGVALAATSSVLFALFFLLAKRVISAGRLDGLTLTGWTALLLSAGYQFLFVVGGGSLPADTTGYAAVLGIALFGTVLAAALLYSGLHHLDAGTAAMLSAVELPLAVLLTAVLVAEPITLVQVAGMGVVLIAVSGLSYSDQRGPASASSQAAAM
jgi:drug/metabolite transporter (DMT)-like permease